MHYQTDALLDAVICAAFWTYFALLLIRSERSHHGNNR